MNARYEVMETGTKKDMYYLQIERIEAYEALHGRYPDYNVNGK